MTFDNTYLVNLSMGLTYVTISGYNLSHHEGHEANEG